MPVAADLVRRGAMRFPQSRAIVFEGQTLTYAEVDRWANRFANALMGLGVQKGDRVALLLDNCLWSVPLDFACLKAGFVRVPLNSRLSLTEHCRMLEETEATVLIHLGSLEGAAAAISERLPQIRRLALTPSEQSAAEDLVALAEMSASTDPEVSLTEDDPMLYIFTSGTTGRLKAAVHTQGSWAAIATNVLANLLDPGPDSVMLHAASLIHASGTYVLPYWLRGGTSVILKGFDPAGFIDAIAENDATEINIAPSMLAMLFASGDATRRALPSLRTVIYGTSPMPRPLLRRGMEAWGPIFVQFFGQTEAPLCITVLDKVDHADPDLLGSCGQPSVDVDVRLRGAEGEPVAVGEIGEVQVRAPFVMKEYLHAPDLTAETFTADGWIRTRDLGRFDDRGYLYLVDRVSDMIVSGGYNVYPREVEDALALHPDVVECAVVGAPDEIWVEAVTAFVVTRDNSTVTAEQLMTTVRAELAGYKVPKAIHFIDAIPKSPVGKPLRRVLREPLWPAQT